MSFGKCSIMIIKKARSSTSTSGCLNIASFDVKRCLWIIALVAVAIGDADSYSRPSRRHSRLPNNVRPTKGQPHVRAPTLANYKNFTTTTSATEQSISDGDYVARKKDEVKIACNLTTNLVDNDYENRNRTIVTTPVTIRTVNHLKWYHNGHEVDYNHRYSKDPVNGLLTISNVRLEDGGFWYCEESDMGVFGKSVSLIVLEEPKMPYLLIDGRRLDAGNQFVPIKENNDLLVTCVVEGGNPPPRIDWQLLPMISETDASPNTEVPTPAVPDLKLVNNSMVTYSSPVVFAEVTLSPVLRIHHNSTIRCVVSHVALQTPLNASILLDVQYAPSFGISRTPGFGYPITEGIRLSLKCDVDSNPPSSPMWKRDNASPPIEQSPDGFLNFSSVQLEDSGWYKCVARYLSVEYASIGYFLNIREYDDEIPELADFPQELIEKGSTLEVGLGGEIQLECPPGSISCWGRSKQPGKVLEPLGPGPNLSLDNIVYQEAGEYKCFVGKNSRVEKWKSRSIEVNVVGVPVVYPDNKNITVVTDQQVTFPLEFCANPGVTKIFWVREQRSFPPGTIMHDIIAHNISDTNTPHCRKVELTIPSVTPSHAGDYTLVVISIKGVAGATVTLNVTTSVSLSDNNNNLRKDAARSISGAETVSATSVLLYGLTYTMLYKIWTF